MYLEHFGLSEAPFLLTPDPRFLYLSKSHSRAITFMEYAIVNRDGFAVITGEIGSGKTTLISKLLGEIDEDTIVAKIYHTYVNEIEFFQSLLDEFGVTGVGDSKVALLKAINKYLLELYSENKKVILIVDEAQNLSIRLLEEIRLVTDLETNNEKLMNLILVGQPELSQSLDSPRLEQLTQRIRFRFHIGPLKQDEMKEYIAHRIEIAHGPKSLFVDNVMSLIYEYTGGIPRLINALCDTALICGYAEGVKTITKTIVLGAIKELEWKPYHSRYENAIESDNTKEKPSNNKKHDIIENDILNELLASQNKHVNEMRHILKRLEAKIEAYEDKLIDLNKEIKSLVRKIK